MILAEWATAFGEEALSFQILFAHGAVEALAVVVVVQRFNPAISCFNREATSVAFGCEQFIPISFAIRTAVFQEERRITEQLSAVRAVEALRVEVLSNCFQAVPFDLGIALGARWGQVLFEAVLAVQLSAFFDEAQVLQRTSA